MSLMGVAFAEDIPYLAFASGILVNFFIYIGHGIIYAYINELAEPFVVGIG